MTNLVSDTNDLWHKPLWGRPVKKGLGRSKNETKHSLDRSILHNAVNVKITMPKDIRLKRSGSKKEDKTQLNRKPSSSWIKLKGTFLKSVGVSSFRDGLIQELKLCHGAQDRSLRWLHAHRRAPPMRARW